jgi:hypothetical protein
MKALKIIGLVLLGILLFAALSSFGLALAVNNSLLNKNFVPNQLDRLEVTPLLEETITSSASGLSPDVHTALIQAVDNLEPQIKQQLRAANSQIYDYLLGKRDTLEIRQVLKETVLGKDFVTSLLNEADTLTFVRKDLRDQLAGLIPPGQQDLVVYLDKAMPSLDPWLQQQIGVVTGPVIDYLLGESSTLQVDISLAPMKATLEASLRGAFLSSPPPALAGTPPDQLEMIFNQYYQAFAAQIPASASIDPSNIGVSGSWAESMTEFDSSLADIRAGFGYFRALFIVLIAVIVLLIAGIVLIHREVKGIARDLGIIFLTFGVIEFLGIIITGYFIKTMLATADIPDAIRTWIPGVYNDFFRPTEILSIVLGIVGIILIVISIIYRKQRSVGEQTV